MPEKQVQQQSDDHTASHPLGEMHIASQVPEESSNPVPANPAPAHPAPLGRRLFWFIGIWAASVFALYLVSLVIKWAVVNEG
jgi:hypothetical protein